MTNFLKKETRSFKNAFKGIAFFLKSETHAKIHLIVAFIVIAAGFVLKINLTEWCIIIISIGFVLTSEAINTAIEKIIDLVSPEYNKIAGIVKDIAAGAVLISSITVAVVGLIIFLPKIIQIFPFH